ncbi:hypothetical protein SporoP8_13430 [Sporosarcina ureae]|uniref:flagellin N-terminal helical domain-containing protein n=1 Tax=Sporosarcina TaxID=1569 RepID=UPI000A167A24|nr:MULTISPECIES: flagellin [Sporosarcina]ARJ39788.1 hypothetical protein SporoP8_13430 [Sporosarcina ureae]
MIINHNMAAMNTHRQLGSNNAAAANNIEKLSSGLKINKAGDDAAGLAISEKMRGQIRGLDMAAKNSQDGISLIQTAEGSLNETHDILQRMRELAVQAGNDTNTTGDRDEIQKELNSLTSEVNRIGNTTEFNTQKLLNGSKGTEGSTTTKAGVTGATIAPETVATQVSVGGFDIEFAGAGSKLNGYEIEIGTSAASTPLTVTVADNKITINGDFSAAGLVDKDDLQTAINDALGAKDLPGVQVTGTSTTATTGATVAGGKDAVTEEITAVAGTYELNVGSSDITIDGKVLKHDSLGADGWKDAASLSKAINDDATLAAKYTASVTDEGKIQLTQNGGQESATAPKVTGNDASLSLQIGANENQSMSVDISDMRSAALGLTGSGAGFTATEGVNNGTDSASNEKALDVSNAKNAANAVTQIQKAIDTVSAERSKLGANQNRLEHTINNLGTSSENLTAAESRIRDVDYVLAA